LGRVARVGAMAGRPHQQRHPASPASSSIASVQPSSPRRCWAPLVILALLGVTRVTGAPSITAYAGDFGSMARLLSAGEVGEEEGEGGGLGWAGLWKCVCV
jgi:hypothetical protein